MKKLFISAFAMLAVALGFTACSSDDELVKETPAQAQKVIAYASIEEPGQRTALGDWDSDKEEYKVVWSENDQITIGGKVFELKEGATTSAGTFELKTDEEKPGAGTDVIAFYPASYDGTNWTTSQTYVEDNIPQGVPMKATGITVEYGEGGETLISPISFKNEGGILCLTLKLQEGGEARNISKVVVSSSELEDDIELNCATPVALTEEGVPFNIAVPAKAYTNLTFTLYDAAGDKCVRSLGSGKTLTVECSKITDVTLTPKTWDYAGLCFRAVEAGATISIHYYDMGGSAPTPTTNLQYSTDLNTWTDFTITTPKTPGTEITLANVDDKVYFRGNNPTGFIKPYNVYYSPTSYTYFIFGDKKIAASGNVMSLIDPTCVATEIPCNYCFYNLFQGEGLTTAPELPATTLKRYCYEEMFYNCSNLTTAPKLPATTLDECCYSHMFAGCKSLTAAPKLPATTLASGCYMNMFSNCTNLTTAPELPAPKLVEGCYNGMFNKCTSLTTAPELPATTLAQGCYSFMFSGCSNLTTAPELPVMKLEWSCYSGMFSNCTSLTTAPELPATTLVENCYLSMFSGCTSLTTAPELPAPMLVEACYCGMFSGCTSLNSVTCLATDISANRCVEDWFYGTAATGTFNCASGKQDMWTGKVNGWTVVEK